MSSMRFNISLNNVSFVHIGIHSFELFIARDLSHLNKEEFKNIPANNSYEVSVSTPIIKMEIENFRNWISETINSDKRRTSL